MKATELAEFYRKNGYVTVPDTLNHKEVEALRREAAKICRGELGAIKGVLPSETGESDDELIQRYLCIHFPHKISDLMLQTMSHPHIVATVQEIIGQNVKSMQSMLFIKAAGKPGQAWHQDEFFIPTRDRSLTGGWIALDDATIENGCLWVIPGSHKHGIIWPQRPHHDPRFDASGEAYNFPYEDSQAVPVEVKAGTVVFFNGYLLHRFLPNSTKAGYRRALVNHYMSAESLLPWFQREGQGIGTLDFRDVVLVAGEDPYAYKGTENITKPFIRRES